MTLDVYSHVVTADAGGEWPDFWAVEDEIADDLAALEGSGVDHVFFYSMAARDLAEEFDLFADLITTVRG